MNAVGGGLRIPGHVGERAVVVRGVRLAGGGRAEHRPRVRAQPRLPVGVGADDEDRVGASGRRGHILVIPALLGAEVVRGVIGVAVHIGGELLPEADVRAALHEQRRVVRAKERGVRLRGPYVRALSTIGRVDARLAVLDREGELGAVHIYRRRLPGEDLLEGPARQRPVDS